MTTIKSEMLTRLQNHGMWPQEAEKIMALVMANEAMRGRWDDSVHGYPQVLINFTWSIVRDTAVEWIDANKPLHFARALLNG